MKAKFSFIAILILLCTQVFAHPQSIRVVGNIAMILKADYSGFYFIESTATRSWDDNRNENIGHGGSPICTLRTLQPWLPSAVGVAFLGGSAEVYMRKDLVFKLVKASSEYVPATQHFNLSLTMALGPTDARMEAVCKIERNLPADGQFTVEELLPELNHLFLAE